MTIPILSLMGDEESLNVFEAHRKQKPAKKFQLTWSFAAILMETYKTSPAKLSVRERSRKKCERKKFSNLM